MRSWLISAQAHTRLRPKWMVVTILFMCAILTAQDKTNIYLPPQTGPSSGSNLGGHSPTSSAIKPAVKLPVTPIGPPRIRDVAQLKREVALLEKDSAELGAIKGRSDKDLLKIGTLAMEIHRTAFYLRRALGIHQSDTTAGPGGELLDREIDKLNESIKEFARSPASRQSNVIDPQILEQALADLDRITSSTTRLLELVTGNLTAKGRKEFTKFREQVRAQRLTLDLDLDCDLWNTDAFLGHAESVSKNGRFQIEDVRLDVRRHRLAKEQVVALGTCAGRDIGLADDETYTAVVREYNSLEVRGKVFAYHVTYRIVVANKRRTVTAEEPLYVLYADYSGSGTFTLDTDTPLEIIPDWARTLARR